MKKQRQFNYQFYHPHRSN